MDIYNLSEKDAQKYLSQKGVDGIFEKGNQGEISPKWDDLARLYKLVRERKPFQILEFGSGFSTIVMAYALKQNWDEYNAILAETDRQTDKRYEQPRMVSIESSEKWRDNTRIKIEKAGLSYFSENVYSGVTIVEYQGQVCHFYDELPDVVPDFVYLDGPDPSTVQGNINGLSFQNSKRTVLSGDILKYESTLLPGFFMIVDGRTNNARFLQRMLRRSYHVQYHEGADVTTFELIEPRLGRKNILGWEAYTGAKVKFAGKNFRAKIGL